ncbi:MAG: VOC family protein [Pseudonocardiaceae bacterium]
MPRPVHPAADHASPSFSHPDHPVGCQHNGATAWQGHEMSPKRVHGRLTRLLSEGVPSHWSIYFGVDDTDAALAEIVDLGGSILRTAEDTPYGRLAAAADPTGAQFKLVGPNTAMPTVGTS